jgi:acyl carrier protein
MADALLSTIAAVLDVEPEAVTDETSMQTCRAWDSLRHLRMVMAIEQALGVRFPSDVIPKMVTVARIREEVARLNGKDT